MRKVVTVFLVLLASLQALSARAARPWPAPCELVAALGVVGGHPGRDIDLAVAVERITAFAEVWPLSTYASYAYELQRKRLRENASAEACLSWEKITRDQVLEFARKRPETREIGDPKYRDAESAFFVSQLPLFFEPEATREQRLDLLLSLFPNGEQREGHVRLAQTMFVWELWRSTHNDDYKYLLLRLFQSRANLTRDFVAYLSVDAGFHHFTPSTVWKWFGHPFESPVAMRDLPRQTSRGEQLAVWLGDELRESHVQGVIAPGLLEFALSEVPTHAFEAYWAERNPARHPVLENLARLHRIDAAILRAHAARIEAIAQANPAFAAWYQRLPANP